MNGKTTVIKNTLMALYHFARYRCHNKNGVKIAARIKRTFRTKLYGIKTIPKPNDKVYFSNCSQYCNLLREASSTGTALARISDLFI